MAVRPWRRQLAEDENYRQFLQRPDYAQLNRLGRQAAAGDTDVWTKLELEIKRLLVAVLCGVKRPIRLSASISVVELIDEAPHDVLAALPNYDHQRPFRNWCWTVLYNKTISKLRRVKIDEAQLSQFNFDDDAQGFAETLKDIAAPDPAQTLFEATLLATNVFHSESVEADLQTIRQWPRSGKVFEVLFWSACLQDWLPDELAEAVVQSEDMERHEEWREAVRRIIGSGTSAIDKRFREVVADFLEMSPRALGAVLRKQSWRWYELRCLEIHVEQPTPGPDFWEEWAWLARREYLDGDGSVTGFPPNEIETIERPRWRRRVYLLTLFRVWPRVPADDWDRWVTEAQIAECSFPPSAITPDTPTVDINKHLIEGTGKLAQRRLDGYWRDGKRLFFELPSLVRLIRWKS